jgi:hypothetical protein
VTITEMIRKLEGIHAKYGDARVEVRNEAGDWEFADDVSAIQHEKPKWIDRQPNTTWSVLIDTEDREL